MTIEWRTIGFPDHLMRVRSGSFRLSNIQMSSGSQISNFVRATGLIAQRWTGQFDMATMSREKWQEWNSFIARIAGQSVLFEVRAPVQQLPLGVGAGFDEDNPDYTVTGVTVTGVDILTGATSAIVHSDTPRYAQSILIDFGGDQAGDTVMRHGDMFGLGGNLYLCTSNVVADEDGVARVPFRWKLHKAAFEGDIVELCKPTCRVMLKEANTGQVELDVAAHGVSGFSFMEMHYLQ